MVSMFKSPPKGLSLRLFVLVGLPKGLRDGLSSIPFMLPGLLVGGLVSGPWLDTGDRMGEGERLTVVGRDVRPARWMLSRDPAMPTPAGGLCSACTTSANEMKDSRRTSEESKDP